LKAVAKPVLVALSRDGRLLAMKEDLEGRSPCQGTESTDVEEVVQTANIRLKDISAVPSVPGRVLRNTGLKNWLLFCQGLLLWPSSLPLITVNTLDTLAWRIRKEEEAHLQEDEYASSQMIVRPAEMEALTCIYSSSLKQFSRLYQFYCG
jgi:hypothetical protein